MLTKPLGSGILTTAAKGDLAEAGALAVAQAQMATLNRAAADLAADLEVHACTDITGFGLLGMPWKWPRPAVQLWKSRQGTASFAPSPPTGGNGDYSRRRLPQRGFRKGSLPSLAAAGPGLLGSDGRSPDLRRSFVALPKKDAAELLRRLESVTPWGRCIGTVLPLGEKALVLEV